MGKEKHWMFMFLFLLICVCDLSKNNVASQSTNIEFPTLSLVEKWADDISSQRVKELDEVTFIESFKQLYAEKNLKRVRIEGDTLIKDVADKWQTMLDKKMTAVEKIVEKLEQGFANYTRLPNITAADVDYYNSKTLLNANESDIVLTYDPRFKSDVNLTSSSVQIPTDIYDEDVVILHGIKATQDVDSVFRRNFEEDPQLLWQYFGSADGFYRSYPAKQWVSATDDERDQYDVRRRGWYIQATSSPKDVMILIDSSGSTYGMTLEIIKVSVSKALDTLGNDDFVYVAYFNDTVKNVSCFNTFVQANLRNKKVLNDAVQNTVTAGHIANFGQALEFAFEQFDNFSRTEKLGPLANNQGADCIRIIMIFTDGGTSSEEAIFKKYNRDPFKVRVFVYKVGADSMVSSEGIKHMACTNKGYYSTIESFGAVRLTTLDYVPVLSRPMVLSGHKNFQWSDIYLDALGLGMMTTLTLPVYNTTSYISQQLLGVVGTDITTKNMADTVPMRTPRFNPTFSQALGPQAYVFGINSNGYILLHPRLKAELSYLSDPPNVDFLEVEYPTPMKTQLRKDMINRNQSVVNLVTPLMSKDERYLETANITYSYTFIDNTTFSVAIAQPSFDLYQYQVEEYFDLNASLKLYITGNDTFYMIAPWVFCAEFEDQEGNITTREIKETIQNSINNTSALGNGTTTLQNCDSDMVKKLLVDAELTSRLAEMWKSKDGQRDNYGILFILASTQGGFTRIWPVDIPAGWSEADKRGRQDPWEQSYYQRSLYTSNYVYSVPYNSGAGTSFNENDTFSPPNVNITISKAVVMDDGVVPAVVAVLLDPVYFNDTWFDIRMGFNNKTANISCVHSDLWCYILDDGGFIIATNQELQNAEVGRFFGEIDGDIMQEMVTSGMYSLKSMFDFQAACPRLEQESSAGIKSWFVPTLTDVINFNMWATSAIWTFIRHTFMDFLLFGWSDVSVTYGQTIETVENISCIKLIKNFYLGENSSMAGQLDCVNCSRRWAASKIRGTNLALIITESECETCPERPVVQRPTDPEGDEAPNPCMDVLEPRYRRRPSENCYAFNPNENVTICRGTVPLASPLLLLVLHVCYLAAARFLSESSISH